MEVTSRTRREILDGLRIEKVDWYGVMDEVEFLGRIFDLSKMPSTDHRFSDAAGDIWQHRINNYDWDDDWVFADRRFNLSGCKSSTFLDFLGQMVHPLVRPDVDEAEELVSKINTSLAKDGIMLAASGSIFGRPEYSAQPLSGAAAPVKHAKGAANVLNAGWMAKEILRIEASIDPHPEAAIGSAKDLVESCCKTIMDNVGKQVPTGTKLPTLVKMTLSELKLTPTSIPNSAKAAEEIKKVLGSLASITNGVAALRNLYGTGHGRAGSYKGLEARHAKLVVISAIAFVTFVTETYQARGTKSSGP